MAAKAEHDAAMGFELPYTNAAELKSNQSVRATFRLSQNTILAINIVANQLGVKQKSLFDHLIADTDALETIARELKRNNQKEKDGINKTFVVSRKTLSTLKKVAVDYNASMDDLVEYSIQRLKPVIDQERDKLESRKTFADKFKRTLNTQKKLLIEATRILGAEDPICEQMASSIDRLEIANLSIETFMEKSEKILDLEINWEKNFSHS